MYDPSLFPPIGLMTVMHQRQSSPEILHPVNSESHRSSLWDRMRGGDRRRSGAEQSRNDWSLGEGSENLESASSRRPSKPNISPQIVRDDEDEVLTSNDAKNPISPDESNHPDRFWISSPKSELASPLSNMLSPSSPLGKDMYPLSTTLSPDTETRDNSSAGAHGEPADGSICLGSLPLMSALTETNDILPPYTPTESRIPVSTQTSQAEANAFELEGTIVPDGYDKPAESETSSWTAKSIVPQVNTGILYSECSSASPPRDPHRESSSQHKNHMLPFPSHNRPATAFHASSFSEDSHYRTSIETSPTLPEMETSDINVNNGCETAPRTSCSFDSINMGNAIVESIRDVEMGEGPQEVDEEDGKLSQRDQKNSDLEQSKTGQPLSFQHIQLQSPLDNDIAALSFELIATDSDTYLDDERQQSSTLHHSRDFATRQAFSIKLLPLCFSCNPFPVGRTVSKHEQVEALQYLVQIVNTEWMQRMKILPELWSRCKILPAPSLFKRAICTMREFIHGKLPQSFEDVFAIVHLAFAAAHLLHWQHVFYSWNTLFDDALQWQHTLSIDEDRSSIAAAMSCWTFPGLDLSSLLNSNYTGIRNNSPQTPLYCGDWKIYHDALRNNEVFRICIGFLDGKSIQRLDLGVSVTILIH